MERQAAQRGKSNRGPFAAGLPARLEWPPRSIGSINPNDTAHYRRGAQFRGDSQPIARTPLAYRAFASFANERQPIALKESDP